MTTSKVIFIDSRLPEQAALLAALAGSGDCYVLDAQTDGVVQMAAILANYSGLQSIHVYSWGSPGAMLLGKNLITSTSLAAQTSQLQAIGQSLAASGDILLYGSSIASTPAGAGLLATLATMTQADVAASDDATGGSGDWVLESSVGVVAAASITPTSYAPSLTAQLGAPLNGSLQGTVGSDVYVGTQYETTGAQAAIQNLTVTDPGGNDVFIAENRAGRLDYISKGIDHSHFTFGDGFISLSVLVEQGYYAEGISGGSLTMGSGNSDMDVVVVESLPDRSNRFVYSATGIQSWAMQAGAGDDRLAVTVQGSRLDTFDITGINGQLDFGDGADRLSVSVTNSSGSQATVAAAGSGVSMGNGSDQVTIASTGYGVTGSTFDLGANGDGLTISSVRNSIVDSRVNAGEGNDTIELTASWANSAELVRSFVDLGAGDDRIELRLAIDSEIQGGDGQDTLVLHDTQASYTVSATADGATLITRSDNSLFSLRVVGVESILFGSGHTDFQYSATALTGFLTGTDSRDDFYYGESLCAAMDDLTVVDLEGNDRVLAENRSESGGVTSYYGAAISSSNFTFGDGEITFEAKINQSYYGTGVNGGSLTMGDGDSFVSIRAIEDFPSDRRGFYYGVTGVENWNLRAGGGSDLLVVTVRGSKTETFDSTGIQGGAYDLGIGDDVVQVDIENLSGTGESVGITGTAIDLGEGSDRLGVVSTGYGIRGASLSAGTGVDLIDVTAVRDAISDTSIQTGSGNDAIFARSTGGNNADFVRVSIQTGSGHDYVECRTAIDSSIDFGDGYDILRLRGERSSYAFDNLVDGSTKITRVGDVFFDLRVTNLESILFGKEVVQTEYSGSPLTGFLGGTAALDDLYRGTGLSAAIENLTVRDSSGNDTVVARNVSASGWTGSYRSAGILNSDFSFGDGLITFSSIINQGYYANAVFGGRLSMGSGDSRIHIEATESYPSERTGFYYGVNGVLNWTLDAGAGADVLEVVVAGQRDGLDSAGINGCVLHLDSGDDVVQVVLRHGAQNEKATALAGVSDLSLGEGNDTLHVFSTGRGVAGSNITGGAGNDAICIRSDLTALSTSSVFMGEGADRLVVLSDLLGAMGATSSSVDMGADDDELQILSANDSTLEGGSGHDRLRLLGAEQDYQIDDLGDGSLRVQFGGLTGPSFVVSGFEEIVFGVAADLGTAGLQMEGDLQVNRTLSVIVTSPDPEGAVASNRNCRWQASQDGLNWRDVGNSAEYTLKPEDEGKLIRVVVDYFDGAGNATRLAVSSVSHVIPPDSLPAELSSTSPDLTSSMLTLGAGDTDATLSGTIYTGASGNSGGNGITGNDLGDLLDGGAGEDTLIGGAGSDVILGGDGNDVVDGGRGDDVIIGGDGAGDDTYAGGLGNDRVVYTSSTVSMVINLGSGLAIGALTGTDHLVGIEEVVGGQTGDRVTGDDSANRIDGYSGDDTLDGGLGNDTLIGGTGIDTASYADATSAISVSLAVSTAQASGGSGSDTLTSIENLTGSNHADRLTGSSVANVLGGGTGNDTLDGGVGADTMVGGDGSDYYYVRDAGDVVTETNATAATGGTDLVYSYLGSYTLGTNVENGRITATGIANLTGNALNNVLYAGTSNNVLNGSTGTDTVSYSYATSAVTASLAVITAQATGGSGSDTFIAIENLTGSAYADRLTGSSIANVLNGGVGADAMTGGDGSDIYYVDNAGDTVTETNVTAATGGTDTAYSYLSSYTLGANVENGRIVAAGAANLTGNALNNFIYAGAGDNVLDGSTGTDTVSYAYATAAVTASLAVTTAQATSGSGSDTFIAIENLTGSNYADSLTGSGIANSLNGGAGADAMIGGDGADTYYVDNVGDVVTETNATAATGGTDLVYSYLGGYTLTTNVENGRILAAGAANLTGNSLANVLYAGAGDNVLDGSTGTDTVTYAYAASAVTVSLAVTTAQATGGSGSDTLTGIENLTGSAYADGLSGSGVANVLNGGVGADTMTGGDGSDIYYVDNVGDVVTETNATSGVGGYDTVYSDLSSYTLGANVENGRITATGAANLTGNGLNNFVYAGAGNNVLDGSTGNDTTSYAYATAAVTVSLAVTTAQTTGGSGSDTLTAIENLTGSTYADKLTGSTGTNALDGGAGNDTLSGGLGADRLTGGTGADTFRFVTTADGSDTITDFASGTDKIYIVAANFGLTAGAGANLVINGTPSSAAAAFVYNSTTGVLGFDSDGNGAGAATQLATLSNKPVGFNSADFVLGA